MELAGPTLLEAMDMIENGTAQPVPQNNDEATYVGMFKKEMGELDFNTSTVKLERLIRGLIPWPGAFTYINGKMLKIWRTTVVEEPVSGSCTGNSEHIPGRLFTDNYGGLFVETADGCLELDEVQLEGKRRMLAADFLRGFKIEEGTVCGRRAD